MTTPNYLVESIIAKATLCLKHNQDSNGGIIDYAVFQEEMSIILQDIETENEALIKALKETVAERDDAIEQRKAIQDVYSRSMHTDFTKWSLT